MQNGLQIYYRTNEKIFKSSAKMCPITKPTYVNCYI